jgi:hypothetical protein
LLIAIFFAVKIFFDIVLLRQQHAMHQAQLQTLDELVKSSAVTAEKMKKVCLDAKDLCERATGKPCAPCH